MNERRSQSGVDPVRVARLQTARPQGLKGVDLHAQLLRPVEAICWQGN